MLREIARLFAAADATERAVLAENEAALARQKHVAAPEQLLVVNRWVLREKIREALAAGAETVVVDLRFTTYVDSSGWGMLLSEKKRANAAGRDVVLASVAGEMEEMLAITRLDRAFAPTTNPRD